MGTFYVNGQQSLITYLGWLTWRGKQIFTFCFATQNYLAHIIFEIKGNKLKNKWSLPFSVAFLRSLNYVFSFKNRNRLKYNIVFFIFFSYFVCCWSPKRLRSKKMKIDAILLLYRCNSYVVNNNVKHLFSPDFNKWYHVVLKSVLRKHFLIFPLGISHEYCLNYSIIIIISIPLGNIFVFIYAF